MSRSLRDWSRPWTALRRVMPLAAMLGVMACGAERGSRAGATDLETVRVLYSGGSERIFSPAWDDTPKFLIFQPLVTYAANSCSDIVGGLAARWDASPDWKTWTVELRPDVRWHDGVPVTSADVAFTVALWKHPDVLFYGAGPVDSVAVIDSLRFRVHLSRPSDWPIGGWTVVYPSHLLRDLDPADFYEWDFWSQPVGNGPFRYVRHVPETMVELAANDDYYLGRPAIDRVRLQFKVGGQGQSGIIEMLAGNVDIVHGLSPLEADLLGDESPFASYYVYQAGTAWLIWNFTDLRFADVRVRRALAHATNRAELQGVLGYPDGVPVTDGVFFMCDPQNISAPAPYAPDPERATALLAEAGWVDRDGDGLLDRDGVPFTFTLVLHQGATTAAVFVQDQLRRIGIDMQLQVLDGNLVRARFDDGDFDAIIVQVPTPERRVVLEDSPIGMLDEELAGMIARATTEPDVDTKLQLWAETGERYKSLAPAMFLHASLSVLAADKRLEGIGVPGSIVRRMSWRHAFGGLEHLRVGETTASPGK